MSLAESHALELDGAAFLAKSGLVPVVVFFLIVVALVAGIALAVRRQRLQREKTLAEVGLTMGLSYTALDESLKEAGFTRLKYFANPRMSREEKLEAVRSKSPAMAALLKVGVSGRGGRPIMEVFSNVLKGRIGGQEAVVFDYQCYVKRPGGAGGRERWRRTVACFRLSRGSMPGFVLHGRVKVPRWLYNPADEVDFTDQPEFSKRYTVSGPDGPAVRKLLAGEPTEVFLQQKGWQVEGAQEWVLVSTQGSGYEHGLEVKKYPEFLEAAGRLASALSKNARS